MAEYFYIENNQKSGKIGISHDVFDEIIKNVVSKIQGVRLSKPGKGFSFHKEIKCEIKNGKVTSYICIKIGKKEDESKLVKLIQDEVSSAIQDMTELIPFTPVVKIAGIDETL